MKKYVIFLLYILALVLWIFDDSPAGYQLAIAPAVGAALVTGGLGLASSIGNWFSGSSSAKKQLQATRETNALNERLFNTQLSYNSDMYNRQVADSLEQYNRETARNDVEWARQRAADLEDVASERDYNSALKQVERLRAAGLNPALTYGQGTNTSSGVSNTGGIQSGSIGMPSAAAAPNAPQMQVPDYTPQARAFSESAQMFLSSINDAYQNSILSEKAKQEKFNTAHQVYRMSQEMARNRETRDLAQMQLKMLKQEYGQRDDLHQLNVESQRWQNKNLASQYRLYEIAERQSQENFLQSTIQTNILKDSSMRISREHSALLSSKAAEVVMYYAQAGASQAEASEAAARALRTTAETEGINFSNRQAKQLGWYAAYTAYYQQKLQQQDLYDRGFDGVPNSAGHRGTTNRNIAPYVDLGSRILPPILFLGR